MNWDQVEGKWKQLKGSARQRWAKFSADDLEFIGGKKDALVGKLQEHYGYSKEQASREADSWCTDCDRTSTDRELQHH